MTLGGNVAEHFIRYTVHNGIYGIKKRRKTQQEHEKTPQTIVQEMQVGSMQLMVLIFVFREHPCQVCKVTHTPKLIRRPAHTFVSSVSREHTQLCKVGLRLRYVHLFISLYLLTVVNVTDAPPVNISCLTPLKQLFH